MRALDGVMFCVPTRVSFIFILPSCLLYFTLRHLIQFHPPHNITYFSSVFWERLTPSVSRKTSFHRTTMLEQRERVRSLFSRQSLARGSWIPTSSGIISARVREVCGCEEARAHVRGDRCFTRSRLACCRCSRQSPTRTPDAASSSSRRTTYSCRRTSGPNLLTLKCFYRARLTCRSSPRPSPSSSRCATPSPMSRCRISSPYTRCW